jgi:hypothetical protein
VGKVEEYAYNLKKALENNLTLGYPQNIVRKEFEYINRKEELEVEEVEEYESFETQEDDYEYDEDEYSEEGYDDDEDEFSDEDEDIE